MDDQWTPETSFKSQAKIAWQAKLSVSVHCLTCLPDLTFPLLEDQPSISYTALTTAWPLLNPKTNNIPKLSSLGERM